NRFDPSARPLRNAAIKHARTRMRATCPALPRSACHNVWMAGSVLEPSWFVKLCGPRYASRCRSTATIRMSFESIFLTKPNQRAILIAAPINQLYIAEMREGRATPMTLEHREQGQTRQEILALLRRSGQMTATELSERLGIGAVGVRQHIALLER